MVIDGNKIAEKILAELQSQPVPQKELAAVLVGNDAASLSFLRQKEKTAQSLGVTFVLHRLSGDLPQEAVIDAVSAISADPKVGGMIVQLPLPKKYDRVAVLNAIGIEKDVDVLNGEDSKVLAPAAGTVARILTELHCDPAGKKAVMVGSGLLIGRPVTDWLMEKAAQLTVLNKGGYDPEIVRQADLVVSGTGVSGLIKGDHLKKGAIVIDFGYGRTENDELAGDVDFASAEKVASFITPTPGGTGPIVVAMLFSNFYKLTQ